MKDWELCLAEMAVVFAKKLTGEAVVFAKKWLQSVQNVWRIKRGKLGCTINEFLLQYG
jgi:hypothetical protein